MPPVPPPSLRVSRRLVLAAQRALQLSRLHDLYTAGGPGGALILMYHGIVTDETAPWVDPSYAVPADAFEAQMEFLARHRRVVRLDDLLDALERGAPIAPGTVVLTFDDGYRSTLDVAAPILARLGLPALVFLATGYVSRGESQFVDVLYSAFNARTCNSLELAHDGRDPVVLRDPATVRRVYDALAQRLLEADPASRARLLERIVEQLRPLRPPPRLTLTWEEAARLPDLHPGLELGAHTREHVDLCAHGPAVAQAEVEASVDDVRGALGVAPRHFSFPFGRSCARSRAAVARAGLRSALVTEPAALTRVGACRYALPRLAAPRDLSLFSMLTSGAYPDVSLAVIGRA